MAERGRGYLLAGGVLSALWLGCQAATVLPGSPAETLRWVAVNTLAFLAGGAFTAAWFGRPSSG